jgi:hypothetical protein
MSDGIRVGWSFGIKSLPTRQLSALPEVPERVGKCHPKKPGASLLFGRTIFRCERTPMEQRSIVRSLQIAPKWLTKTAIYPLLMLRAINIWRGCFSSPTRNEHQTRYCISYAWPFVSRCGETHNKRARSGFASMLPGLAPAGLRANCLSRFGWAGMLPFASASKTYLYPCRRTSRTSTHARSHAWAGSKGESLETASELGSNKA